MDEILYLHKRQLEMYGGGAGIRDLGALQSALGMPEAGLGEDYFHKDLWEMGAAYLFHLCQNHPFVDGNKRVALAACRYFLAVNGVDFAGDSRELLDWTLGTASGKKKKPEIAAWLKSRGKVRRRP